MLPKSLISKLAFAGSWAHALARPGFAGIQAHGEWGHLHAHCDLELERDLTQLSNSFLALGHHSGTRGSSGWIPKLCQGCIFTLRFPCLESWDGKMSNSFHHSNCVTQKKPQTQPNRCTVSDTRTTKLQHQAGGSLSQAPPCHTACSPPCSSTYSSIYFYSNHLHHLSFQSEEPHECSSCSGGSPKEVLLQILLASWQ